MALKKLKMQEVIERMFKQYGLSEQEVKTVNQAIHSSSNDEIDVEEDIANKLGQSLLTVESAKANSDVRSAIKAEVLNGIDALGTQLLEEYKVPDERLAEIKAEKSTPKRIKLITKLIADMKGEEAAGTTKDSKAAAEALRKLNEEMAGLKDTHKTEIESLKRGFDVERVGSKIGDIYSKLDYALSDVPKEVAIAAARGVMKQIEETDGVEYKLTDTGLELWKKDGTQYFDPTSNKPVPPMDYIQRNLQTHKLLKVSAPPGNGQKPPPARKPAPTTGVPEVTIKNREELTRTIEQVRSQEETN